MTKPPFGGSVAPVVHQKADFNRGSCLSMVTLLCFRLRLRYQAIAQLNKQKRHREGVVFVCWWRSPSFKKIIMGASEDCCGACGNQLFLEDTAGANRI